ncbi:MAG: NAD-dependent epimerase/dehydratase family protein [Bryobacteraceae bacterium]|nr:NAD-dependent epimerase/dehydratase family protein [Bryobacteraceae bacterium]
MNVFVTGAAGYIGSAVCDLLRQRGHTVTGLTRSHEKAETLRARGDQPLIGEVDDADLIYAACNRSDAVIHCAMEFNPSAGVIDSTAVRHMIDAMRGSLKPLVYTSGVWVYGDTRGRTAGEASALHTPDFILWRTSVEKMVVSAKEAGISAVVLRPGMVFGRGGGALAGMFRQARTGNAIRIVGDGENHWSTVHIDDLAELYLHVITRPAAGEIFIATGGIPHQVKRIASEVAARCGNGVKVESTPLGLATAQMGPIAAGLALDQKVASTKAARFFGWAVRHPSVIEHIRTAEY